jgi:hypothetical protein
LPHGFPAASFCRPELPHPGHFSRVMDDRAPI